MQPNFDNTLNRKITAPIFRTNILCTGSDNFTKAGSKNLKLSLLRISSLSHLEIDRSIVQFVDSSQNSTRFLNRTSTLAQQYSFYKQQIEKKIFFNF